MLTQTLPRSAESYSRAQRAEVGRALIQVRALWRRMGPEFDASYAAIAPSLLAVVTTAQERVAAGAQDYIPAVLAETGQSRADRPAAVVSTAPLVGVAGDGRPVEGLLYGAVVHAKQQVYVGPPRYDEDLDEVFTPGPGRTPRQALASAGQWLTMAVGTALSDTGRQSESLATGVRPVGGYVRMLTPPSCSRCVVLAGKWYRKNAGFARHPGCDCRSIPASESVAGDLTVDGFDYVDSLSEADQDRLLGHAGAEAWRSGADLNQVVNARRGMRTAQIGGRDVLITTEGTTRRGLASRARTGRRGPRLMPETALSIAKNREDYLRLLRANGYILR